MTKKSEGMSETNTSNISGSTTSSTKTSKLTALLQSTAKQKGGDSPNCSSASSTIPSCRAATSSSSLLLAPPSSSSTARRLSSNYDSDISFLGTSPIPSLSLGLESDYHKRRDELERREGNGICEDAVEEGEKREGNEGGSSRVTTWGRATSPTSKRKKSRSTKPVARAASAREVWAIKKPSEGNENKVERPASTWLEPTIMTRKGCDGESEREGESGIMKKPSFEADDGNVVKKVNGREEAAKGIGVRENRVCNPSSSPRVGLLPQQTHSPTSSRILNTGVSPSRSRDRSASPAHSPSFPSSPSSSSSSSSSSSVVKIVGHRSKSPQGRLLHRGQSSSALVGTREGQRDSPSPGYSFKERGMMSTSGHATVDAFMTYTSSSSSASFSSSSASHATQKRPSSPAPSRSASHCQHNAGGSTTNIVASHGVKAKSSNVQDSSAVSAWLFQVFILTSVSK